MYSYIYKESRTRTGLIKNRQFAYLASVDMSPFTNWLFQSDWRDFLTFYKTEINKLVPTIFLMNVFIIMVPCDQLPRLIACTFHSLVERCNIEKYLAFLTEYILPSVIVHASWNHSSMMYTYISTMIIVTFV